MLDNPTLSDLLDFALKPESLQNTIFGIALNCEKPWSFMEELASWLQIWHAKLGSVLSQLPLDEQDQLLAKITKHH